MKRLTIRTKKFKSGYAINMPGTKSQKLAAATKRLAYYENCEEKRLVIRWNFIIDKEALETIKDGKPVLILVGSGSYHIATYQDIWNKGEWGFFSGGICIPDVICWSHLPNYLNVV